MRTVLSVILLGGIALAQQPAGSPSPAPPAAAPPAPTVAPRALGPSGAGARSKDSDEPPVPRELLPDLPPLPTAQTTRIGGTIHRLDRVLDRIHLDIFGGGSLDVLFDGRTQIMRDQNKALLTDLKAGERVSVDTVLMDGGAIFARRIHILARSAAGESQGQIVSFEPRRGELLLHDPLAPRQVAVRMASYTRIERDDKPVDRTSLVPGALVNVQFVSDGQGHPYASRIAVLAMPGKSFRFNGEVSYLDLRAGIMAITNQQNNTTYEIHFNPEVLTLPSDVHERSVVTVTADFDGQRYTARQVEVNNSNQ